MTASDTPSAKSYGVLDDFIDQSSLVSVTEHKLSNGGIYTGAARKKTVGTSEELIQHGYGDLIFPDGSKYMGNWCNGQAHGKGTMNHSNGDVYIGDFINDQATGKGTFTKANNRTYEGEWLEGMRHG